jgi:putative transposase
MSTSTSPSTSLTYGLKRVCNVWAFPRSTVYLARKQRKTEPTGRKRGPTPTISDEKLLDSIKLVIGTSKFTGEGHRKVWARLRRFYGICVGRNRVLRLMREAHLLSPHRARIGKAKKHDGRIVTDKPNDMWATDAVKIWTEEDGWVWYFGVADHWNSECLGWHVAKRGDRYAAMEALRQAVRSGCGGLLPEIARGISLRPDHGSVFTAKEYRNEARYWGFGFSYSLVGEPETNGVEEMFYRTMKEQCIHGQIFKNVEEVREAISSFVDDYNNDWLLEKLSYRSPKEARKKWTLKEEASVVGA